MSKIGSRPRPVVLVVLDGWGVAPPWGGNAILMANTPFFSLIRRSYPFSTLQASGEAVGLSAGERGNSEVGHLNIGTGQIILQALPSITQTIIDGSFFTNETLLAAFRRAQERQRAVHLIGLTSDGGIHSHINHLYSLIDLARSLGNTNVYVHAITDGRDSPPFVAEIYLSRLGTYLKQTGVGRIGTVSGRYYAMDRDHRWERIEKVYRAITEGIGPIARTAEAAVAASYREGYSDEFIVPTIIQGENNIYQPLQNGDSIVFFNFRADRARELTQAFLKSDFDGFRRRKVLKDLYFVGFTYFQEGLPMAVAFQPRNVNYPLARILAEAKLTQLHIAESEKYAHVTYFFNGGREQPYPGEDRLIIPSPKVASYDQVPGMSTERLTDTVIHHLGRYDVIICNFACPDMVGHTGNLRASIKACEIVDANLSRIKEQVLTRGGLLIITADHGNIEQMVNPITGEPDTEHTTNPVPFFLVGHQATNWLLRSNGLLADIAPTVLDILGLVKPTEMTGTSLLIKNQNAPITTTNSIAAPVT